MDSKSLEHLKERRNSLNRCFMRKKPPENGDSHARILDDYFIERFSVSLAGFKLDLISNPYAIIATGSYGRKEVFPLPDVRVLFIFKDSIPQGAVELIRDIVYPLWDLGYTVHHSTKTLKEAVAGAAADYGTLLSLLDSRFVCGVSPLYSRLVAALREKIVVRKRKDILGFLLERDQLRHKKFESPEFILEPDLFSAPGGLSDIGSLVAASRIAFDVSGLQDMDKTKIFSTRDREDLLAALEFIRNTLVFIQLSNTGDKGRLTVDLQPAAGRFFNYKNKGPDKAVDFFLTDLEKWRCTVKVLQRRVFSYLLPDKTPGFSPEKDMKTREKWVAVSKGFVKITSFSKLKKHPELLLSIVALSEENLAPVAAETQWMMAEFRSLVPDHFFIDPRNMECFEYLLLGSAAWGNTLDILAETGLFFSFIPELKGLEHKKVFAWQPAHSLFKHTLLTVSHLKDVISSDRELSQDARLAAMWAALLHTLVDEHRRSGKTSEVVRSVLARFGKTHGFVKKVQNLVDMNRRMLGILHGEDLWDDTVFRAFSHDLGTPTDLNLLYRLCLSDIRSRASRCYSDFKEADLAQGVMSLARLKGWPPPSGLENAGKKTLRPLFPEAIPVKDVAMPGIRLEKTDNMRLVSLGFPVDKESVLPALRALAFSGIDLYDLRLFPPENGWKDLLIRAIAPRDTMFEWKKWMGFEKHLKDLMHGETDEKAGKSHMENGKPIENKEHITCPETGVTVTRREADGKTMIVMHRPQTFDALPQVVSRLAGEGLAPYYIKKTCCERDFCLVIHADNVGNTDEKKVREVIHGILHG